MRGALAWRWSCLALACAPPCVGAQLASGGREAALSGAGLVFVTGAQGVGSNPANLAWWTSSATAALQVGASGAAEGATLAGVRSIARAGGNGKAGLLAGVPPEGVALRGVLDGAMAARVVSASGLPTPTTAAPSVAVTLGPLGLGLRSRVYSDVHLAHDLVDLTVRGFRPDRGTPYVVDGSLFRVAEVSELTAAYGVRAGRAWALGAAVRYVFGGALLQGRFYDPAIDVGAGDLALAGAAVESPGGWGVGLDLAASYQLSETVRISASAVDVLQRMRWDETLSSHEATLTASDLDQRDAKALVRRYDTRVVQPDGTGLDVYEASLGLFEEAFFPTTLRAGVGWSEGATTVELVGSVRVGRGWLSVPWDDRVSLGGERRIGPATLRAGVGGASGGLLILSGGVGWRIGTAELDVGGGSLTDLSASGRHGGAHLSIGLSVARPPSRSPSLPPRRR